MRILSRFNTSSLLWKAFGGYIWQIILLGMLGFVSSVLTGIGVSAIIPLFSFLIADGGVEASGTAARILVKIFSYLPFAYSLRSLLALIIGLFLVRAVVLFAFMYIRSKVSLAYQFKTASELFAAMLRARWQFFLKQKLGHMQTTLVHDVHAAGALLESLTLTFLALINAAVLLGFAVMISPRVTSLVIAAGVVVLFIMRPLSWRLRMSGAALDREDKHIAHYLVEQILGMKTIKVAAVEDAVFAEGRNHFSMWRDIALRREFFRSVSKLFAEPLSVIFVSYAFAFSYHTPGFSIQAFAATMYLIQRIFTNLEVGQTAAHNVSEKIPHIEALVRFRKRLTRSEEPREGKLPFHLGLALDFDRVSFGYTSDALVLSRISFSIGKGEMVGLIGPSGAGKTSIADILMRLFDPQEGRILLDGQGSEEFDLASWRGNIGYVSQDIFLFNDTIERNIKFFNPDISDADMVLASKQANIYDFICQQPQGFQTVIGDRGLMLSGGQRQRVVLARVLARKPEVLILDEATSALDNESEVLIQKAIEDLRGKITVCIIAHRLSTIVGMDRILVLEKGAIVEEGDPQELLQNKDSYFYRMYHFNGIA